MEGRRAGLGLSVAFLLKSLPLRSLSTGPAGGVVGYSRTAFNPQTRQPVIGFDMGGTSTDVSRYDGTLHHLFETTIAGITIQAPQLDISTVGLLKSFFLLGVGWGGVGGRTS